MKNVIVKIFINNNLHFNSNKKYNYSAELRVFIQISFQMTKENAHSFYWATLHY